MTVEHAEENDVMTIIQIKIVTRKGVVFSQRIADSIHNACFWLQENAEVVQEVWNKHINDEPKLEMEDVAMPQGWDN